MQGYDILMIAIIAGAMIFGAIKGMAWQIASLASLVLSYFVSLYFSGPLVSSGLFGLSSPWNRFAAMFSVYSVTGAVVWFLFRQVSATIEAIKLREFDRQLGAIFGAFKGALLCTAVTFFLVTLTPQYRDSVMHSYSGQFIARKINEADAVLPTEWHDDLGPYIHRFEESFNLTPSHPDDLSHKHVDTNNPGGMPTPNWPLYPSNQPVEQGRGASAPQQQNTYQPQYPAYNPQSGYPVAQPAYPNAQPTFPNTQPTYPNTQPSYPNPQPAPGGYRPSYDPNAYPQGNYQSPTYPQPNQQQQIPSNYNQPNYQPSQPTYNQTPYVQNGNPQYSPSYSASNGYPTQNNASPQYQNSPTTYAPPTYSQPGYAQPTPYAQQPNSYPPANSYNSNQYQTGYPNTQYSGTQYSNTPYQNGPYAASPYSSGQQPNVNPNYNATPNAFTTPGINPGYGTPAASPGYNTANGYGQVTAGPSQEPTFWNWIEMVTPAVKQLK